MSPEDGVGEEMKEVEMELEEKEFAQRQKRRKSSISPYVLESGRARRSRSNSRLPAPARSPSSSPARSPSPSGSGVKNMVSGLNNLFSLLLSPAWVQTFVMTFLGEWGDRSQIATIAMAAGSDYWWVTAGAVIGHGCCTAIAVVGGRAIAGKVSMRVGKSSPMLGVMEYVANKAQSLLEEPLPSLRLELSTGWKPFTTSRSTAPTNLTKPYPHNARPHVFVIIRPSATSSHFSVTLVVYRRHGTKRLKNGNHLGLEFFSFLGLHHRKFLDSDLT
jgi:putative Ca2+/H+ antiporter (TMEM165/GDT1 family)